MEKPVFDGFMHAGKPGLDALYLMRSAPWWVTIKARLTDKRRTQ